MVTYEAKETMRGVVRTTGVDDALKHPHCTSARNAAIERSGGCWLRGTRITQSRLTIMRDAA
jgi:hypothetical protein